MTAGHTPGPWTVVHGVRTLINSSHRSVASTAVNGKRTTAEDEANARLIASAPALLAALEKCADMVHREYCAVTCNPACDAASAAIATARGGGI